MKRKNYYVYLATNKWNTVLYTGVTNNIERRILEHREGRVQGFTKKYKIRKLVYVEQFPSAIEAIEAEKRIKGWKREKKVALIKSLYPEWRELSPGDASLRSA